MQDSFLTIYPKITHPDSSHHLSGLWLAHGDEPLLQQWLSDALQKRWHQQNLAIKRVDLVSAQSWQDVLSELNSLSLFDDATAVIVTGNHKPDKHIQSELAALSVEINNGTNQNTILWLTAKADKRSQNSKWFTTFAKYGTAIDCNLYNEDQRQHLLTLQAQSFGLKLAPEAWQFLMVQTEHHLLSAYQALWRLSYLFAPDISPQDASNHPVMINIDDLKNALVSEAQYTVFDLSDAMLAGDAAQVIKVLEQLRATDEPTPLILWVLTKEMRIIMQLLDGQDPNSLGIWRNKQAIYRNACQRQSQQSTADWADMLYQCDKAIKGVINQPAWELLLQAALSVAGYRLFK